MKTRLLAIVVTLISFIAISGVATAQGQYISGSVGVDVSYPNCRARISGAAFGIVGVNGGKSFSPNPCMKDEASKFKNLSLYINTGYPGQTYGIKYQNYPNSCNELDLNCLAYNYGYNAAEYAYKYAENSGVQSSTWWLDVETMNSWTPDFAQNIQSLKGQEYYLRTHGVSTVGIYSTTYQWGQITGGWQNNLPSWGATTWRTASQAATFCNGHEFTGGPSYLMQFLGRLDQNVAC